MIFKKFLCSLSFIILLLSHSLSIRSLAVDDSPPVDFVSDWANYAYSQAEGYIISKYTSLGQAGWAVEGAKLGLSEAYRNCSWAIEYYNYFASGGSGLNYSIISSGGSFSGLSRYSDGSYSASSSFMSSSSISFRCSRFSCNSYASGSFLRKSTSSSTGIPTYDIYELSGGLPPIYNNYSNFDFSVYVSSRSGSSPGSGVLSSSADVSVVIYPETTSLLAGQDTYPPATFYEYPVEGYSNAGQASNPHTYMFYRSYFSFSDLGGIDFNNPQNAVDALNNWISSNYPDYVDENPLPGFDFPNDVPSFVLPPDLPFETFPTFENPDIPESVLEKATGGTSFWFNCLTQLIDSLDIMWLVYLALFIGLFCLIFLR